MIYAEQIESYQSTIPRQTYGSTSNATPFPGNDQHQSRLRPEQRPRSILNRLTEHDRVKLRQIRSMDTDVVNGINSGNDCV